MFFTASKIIQKLQNEGYQTLFAGGCVRDMLLENCPKDIDIATSALPEDVKKIFPKNVAVGESFGVIVVMEDGYNFEIASFRKDKDYTDSRHPTGVEFLESPREDALRRDLTVNGLFYDPITDEFIDYVGGLKDLKNKTIRLIGNPYQRLEEDALRLMRVIRFAVRFDFDIEYNTFKAVKHCAHKINKISNERIRDELVKILDSNNPDKGLELLSETGLLKHILPEIEEMKSIEQSPQHHPEGTVWNHTLLAIKKCSVNLRIAALFHDVGKKDCQEFKEGIISFYNHAKVGSKKCEEILKRLKFTNKEIEKITWLVKNHMRLLDCKKMKKSSLLKLIREEWFKHLLELHKADALSSNKDLSMYYWLKDRIEEFSKIEKRPKRLLTGNDLKELGYKPGPVYSTILNDLENKQLEGSVNTKEEAVKYVRFKFTTA